jgi:hypothetical protein
VPLQSHWRKKIAFCPLHQEAETLLEVCSYLWNFLQTVKVARPGDEELIQEVILPYVREAIDPAAKAKGAWD